MCVCVCVCVTQLKIMDQKTLCGVSFFACDHYTRDTSKLLDITSHKRGLGLLLIYNTTRWERRGGGHDFFSLSRSALLLLCVCASVSLLLWTPTVSQNQASVRCCLMIVPRYLCRPLKQGPNAVARKRKLCIHIGVVLSLPVHHNIQ